MPLANTIKELSRNIRGGCAYQSLYERLSKEDQKALDEAWAKDVPLNLIVRALRQEGHKTSSDSVRAHRKGQCKCAVK